MKNFLLLICIFSCGITLKSQSTFESVYNLIQTNCSGCHTPGHESGLTLSGTIGEVYDAIYNLPPNNSTSNAKGNKIIFPGDPYKSFLFTKINNDLALDVSLEAGEGTACPKDAAPLNNKDIEFVRQWIIYGAKETGTQVNIDLITDFYDNEGIQSVPSPPAAPPASEGFQIHYGPWFLAPGDEAEYWSKFATNLPEEIEIKSLEIVMGDYSHHYIIYKYETPTHVLNPYGLRILDPEFIGVSMVTAAQYSNTLNLPQGTAFIWPENTWLDLNSHYINYSMDKTMACEVYINIYTQPSGTALYEMHSDLPNNTDIYIPNDSQIHTFTDAVYDPGNTDEIFIWAMSSHTHKYGYDYDIFMRNSDGTKGEHIFDGSCEGTSGAPGCPDEIYDYQHPPIRYWENFLPVVPKNGIIHEAKYYNNGPEPVWFGLTSDDEMMVMMYFFIEDTAGLNLPTAIAEIPTSDTELHVFPNPSDNTFYIRSGFEENTHVEVDLFDITGHRTSFSGLIQNGLITIQCDQLPSGIYQVRMRNYEGAVLNTSVLLY